MTKREQLHHWMLTHGDWLYLADVPNDQFGMSRATCSSALIVMCEQGRAEFRVVGLKQYKGIAAPTPKQGRGTLKLAAWRAK
jgi:hypothetical protein